MLEPLDQKEKFLTMVAALLLLTGLTFSEPSHSSVPASIQTDYQQLKSQAPHLSPKVLKKALVAYKKTLELGHDRRHILTIIDYSKPSTQQRLWTFDLNRHQLLLHSLVAHGRGSGNLMATHFSNLSRSHSTSLGVFTTGHIYYGHKGLSLRLNGLEPGFNDHARSRAVVVHGARYVSPSIASRFGRIGRSWGCPAVPVEVAKPLINTIKNDTVLFAYYPDQNWLLHSKFLRT